MIACDIQTEASMNFKTAHGRKQTDDLKRFYANKSCLQLQAFPLLHSRPHVSTQPALQPSLHQPCGQPIPVAASYSVGLLQFLDPQRDHNGMAHHKRTLKGHLTCSM